MSSLQLHDQVRWSRHYYVERLEDDFAVLVGARDHFVLRGRSRVEALTVIDGISRVDSMLARRSDQCCAIQMYETFEQLLQAGIWRVVRPSVGVQPEYRPDSATNASLEHALEQLRLPGLGDIEAGQQVLVGDYLDRRVQARAEQYRVAGVPWLVIDPFAPQPCVGPVFTRAPGPCWSCVQYWIALNRPARIWRERVRPAGRRPAVRATEILESSNELIERCVRYLKQLRTVPLRSAIWQAGQHSEMPARMHAIVRRPQCPECGDGGLRSRLAGRPLRLQERRINSRSDGGYRTDEPAQIYNKFAHHVSPLTGAVCELQAVEPEAQSCAHVFRSRHRITPWRPSGGVAFSNRCWGKGQSSAQARSSAICEALERFAGVYEGDVAVRCANLGELGAQAIDPQALQLFSEGQLQEACLRPQPDDARTWCARALPATQMIRWTPAFRLADGQRSYVPLCYCYAHTPPWPDLDYARPVSNGSAAGRYPEDAILQGLLELIERDAIALWWYNCIVHPAVDLDAFDLEFVQKTRVEYRAQGWQLWVLDLTQDFEIPVCAALAYHPGRDRYSVGFGCHLRPELALGRALTELDQMSVILNRDYAPWDSDSLESTGFLRPCPHRISPLGRRNDPEYSGLLAAIDFVHRKLEGAGLSTYIVNKSRPDIELSVVQVIVPGLRHFWRRLGQGRLFDVPQQLGWVSQRPRERGLNPALLRI